MNIDIDKFLRKILVDTKDGVIKWHIYISSPVIKVFESNISITENKYLNIRLTKYLGKIEDTYLTIYYHVKSSSMKQYIYQISYNRSEYVKNLLDTLDIIFMYFNEN